MAPAPLYTSTNTPARRRRPFVLPLFFLLTIVLGGKTLHSAAAGVSSSASSSAAALSVATQRRPRVSSLHARAPPLAMAGGANPIAALKSLVTAYSGWLVRLLYVVAPSVSVFNPIL